MSARLSVTVLLEIDSVLNDELAGLRAERATWERPVLLLRPGSIDPDMLDERARTLLNYADPRDLTLRLKPTMARP